MQQEVGIYCQGLGLGSVDGKLLRGKKDCIRDQKNSG